MSGPSIAPNIYSYKRIHFSSHVSIRSRNGSLEFRRESIKHSSKFWTLILFGLIRDPFIELFALAVCMGWIEILTWSTWDISLTLWCDFYKTIVSENSLSSVHGCPSSSSSRLSIFKASIATLKFLKMPFYSLIHCRVCSLCSVDFYSCLGCPETEFELMQEKLIYIFFFFIFIIKGSYTSKQFGATVL